MTKQQEMVIARIKRDAVSDICPNATDYELKQFEVTEYDHFVAVLLVTGLKNDEGTLAAVYCRDRAHVFIGRRGGITYPVDTKRHGMVRRELGRYHSLLHVVCEQKY